MATYRTLKLSQKEMRRQLEEREGGRAAGRGDSPYTQEAYEEMYGLKKKKEEKQ